MEKENVEWYLDGIIDENIVGKTLVIVFKTGECYTGITSQFSFAKFRTEIVVVWKRKVTQKKEKLEIFNYSQIDWIKFY